MASYETITVPAGETRQFQIGTGETFANKLIDITADGADLYISADGSNWTIRNVGVRGQIEAYDDPPFMIVRDTEGGTSRIENCFFGHGGKGELYDRSGIFVHARHAGNLAVDRVNMANFKGDAVYASPPGNPNAGPFSGGDVGQGGTVEVTNAYFENNMIADVRLGSTGSRAENVVSVNNAHRSFWGYYENTEYVNCDASGSPRSFEAGGNAHDKQGGAVMNLTNCRADGDIRPKGGATVNGNPSPNPRTNPPAGVPTTPEQAASGRGGNQNDKQNDTGSTPSNAAVSNRALVAGIGIAAGAFAKKRKD